ncbi:MAG: hypothetical protein RIR53_342 [Bacteroidota bacterium]|jgi:hypothetical protein
MKYLVLLVLMCAILKGANDSTRYQRITDLIEIDTVVRVGDLDESFVPTQLTSSEDGLWLPSRDRDGSLRLRGWTPRGIQLPDLIPACEEAPDSVTTLRLVGDVSLGYGLMAIVGKDALVTVRLDDLKKGKSARRYTLPQEFDRCHIVNDSLVVAWRWRFYGELLTPSCYTLGIVNLKSGQVRRLVFPVAEGLCLAYSTDFSNISCIRGQMFIVDPLSGDIWRAKLTDADPSFSRVVRGTLRLENDSELRNLNGDLKGGARVSKLLEMSGAWQKIDGEVIRSVHQLADSLLIVVKCPYAKKRKAESGTLNEVDVYEFRGDSLHLIARDLTNDFLGTDVPCTRDKYPVLLGEGRLRTVGSKLVTGTLAVPFQDCCNGKTKFSELKDCMQEQLNSYDKLPLMLVSYRLKSRRP